MPNRLHRSLQQEDPNNSLQMPAVGRGDSRNPYVPSWTTSPSSSFPCSSLPIPVEKTFQCGDSPGTTGDKMNTGQSSPTTGDDRYNKQLSYLADDEEDDRLHRQELDAATRCDLCGCQPGGPDIEAASLLLTRPWQCYHQLCRTCLAEMMNQSQRMSNLDCRICHASFDWQAAVEETAQLKSIVQSSYTAAQAGHQQGDSGNGPRKQQQRNSNNKSIAGASRENSSVVIRELPPRYYDDEINLSDFESEGDGFSLSGHNKSIAGASRENRFKQQQQLPPQCPFDYYDSETGTVVKPTAPDIGTQQPPVTTVSSTLATGAQSLRNFAKLTEFYSRNKRKTEEHNNRRRPQPLHHDPHSANNTVQHGSRNEYPGLDVQQNNTSSTCSSPDSPSHPPPARINIIPLIRQKNIAALRAALEQGPEVANPDTQEWRRYYDERGAAHIRYGPLALEVAFETGCPEIVELLLSFGATIDGETENKACKGDCLESAIRLGKSAECVRIALEVLGTFVTVRHARAAFETWDHKSPDATKFPNNQLVKICQMILARNNKIVNGTFLAYPIHGICHTTFEKWCEIVFRAAPSTTAALLSPAAAGEPV